MKDIPENFVAREQIQKTLSQFKDKLPAGFLTFCSEQGDTCAPDPAQTTVTQKERASASDFEIFWQLQIRKEKKAKARQERERCGLNSDALSARQVIERRTEQKRHRLQYRDPAKTPLAHNWLANRQREEVHKK